jgi:predicted CopG family antitoxin
MSTTIRVGVDVKRRLEELKGELGLHSHSEVIERLLERTSDPKAALDSLYYWIMDVRRDVKRLIELLEKLTAEIERLQRAVSR